MENSVYNIYDPLGMKLLNRLRLGFSHLQENKFRQNFPDILIYFRVLWKPKVKDIIFDAAKSMSRFA